MASLHMQLVQFVQEQISLSCRSKTVSLLSPLSLGAMSICLVSVLTNVSNELSMDESCFLVLGDLENALVAVSPSVLSCWRWL